MRKSHVVTLLTGTLLSLNAHAADLLQVYKEALINDAQYSSARAALAAGQERVVQGRAGLLPTVAVSGGYSRTETEASQAGISAPRRDFSGNNYAVSLAQPLFRWGNWQQYQQAKLATAVSGVQFEQAQQELILRVAQAYFDVLAAQDTLATVQAQKSAITEQLASAKRNFEVGTATITDSHEAQARYDLAIAQEFAAINELDIRRAALQQIIGKPPGELAPLRPGVKLSAPEPTQVDPWVQSALQQNYAVLAQQFAVEIARHDIKRNRAGHLPTVDLVASHNRGNQFGGAAGTTGTAGAAGGSSNSNTIGVQWSMPLFAGFAITSRVRESIALEDKARADLENTQRVAAQAARQAYLGVVSGLAQVKALEAAEISSQSALESNRLGYQVGVRINIDVLNAQQQLFSTRRDLARARYETILNGLRLKSATGSLTEQEVAVVNSLLKP